MKSGWKSYKRGRTAYVWICVCARSPAAGSLQCLTLLEWPLPPRCHGHTLLRRAHAIVPPHRSGHRPVNACVHLPLRGNLFIAVLRRAQRERDQVLVRFANNSSPVLVATDVAARGLDIKSLQAVINYELPRDPEIYIHRIGRTGRAGEKGLALSIFAESEQYRVKAIEDYQKKPCVCDVYLSLDRDPDYKLQSPMVTIQLDAGRKNKMRPGDLLGALTGDAGLAGSQIGKIDIFDMTSYVAIERGALRQALNYLANGKVKGRTVRARKVG